MKKIICSALLAIMVLSLTACMGDKGGSSGNVGNGNNVDSSGNLGSSNNKNGISSMISSVGSAVESTTSEVASKVTNITAKITADQAKKTALDHAGLKESEVTDIDIDLDRDDEILKYEVDFRHGKTEYDYDINAETGKIISADKDND